MCGLAKSVIKIKHKAYMALGSGQAILASFPFLICVYTATIYVRLSCQRAVNNAANCFRTPDCTMATKSLIEGNLN